MKRKLFFFSLLILFLSSSCSEKKAQFENLLELPLPLKRFELRIDSLSSYKILYPQYVIENSKQRLITLNYNLNRLDFYELDEGSLEKSITYDPNLDFWKISGYSYVNKDSIFLINEVNDLFLTNYDGEIKSKINVKISSVVGKPHIIPGYLDPVISKSHIEIPNYFVAQKGIPSRVQFNDWADESLKVGIQVEDDFVDGYYGIFEYLYWTYQQVGDFFYVNWPNLSEVYKYDLNWRLVEKINLSGNGDKNNRLIFKRGLLPEELRQKPTLSEMRDISSNYTSNFVFLNFLYNPFTNEFYRIVAYPIANNFLDIFQLDFENSERDYSIIVFDRDLNFKNEYAIAKGKYLIQYGAYFVTPDGLAIQRENEETDDVAVFEVFKFD